MGGYSKEERELIRSASFGRCASCGRKLDKYEAHDILAMGHMSPHQGLALCHDCHENTLTYGNGQRGIFDYYAGSRFSEDFNDDDYFDDDED